MAGYDTASFVYNAWPGVSGYGTPLFWLRYFSPCYTTPLNTSSSNANNECRAIWNSNSSSPMLGPITVPYQPRLSGTSAEVKERAVTLFYEQMVIVEKQLGHIHDDLRLE